MNRSSRFLSFAVIACAAAAGAFVSAAVTARDYVMAAAHRAWDLVTSVRIDVGLQPKAPGQEKPRAALVAAKAFVVCLAKRERPRVTPLWRMCPST